MLLRHATITKPELKRISKWVPWLRQFIKGLLAEKDLSGHFLLPRSLHLNHIRSSFFNQVPRHVRGRDNH